MNIDEKKLKGLDDILNRFLIYIKANIQRFNLQNKGIDPEDILQEVKIKIWKLLNDEKKINHYPSYIKKIVNSSVIDHLRKIKREEQIIISEKHKKFSELRNAYDPYNSCDLKLRKKLAQCVESLMESRRKVVKLFLLNMSIEEIAIFYKWSTDKTRNLLYRGLSDLKIKLKEMDITYEYKSK